MKGDGGDIFFIIVCALVALWFLQLFFGKGDR